MRTTRLESRWAILILFPDAPEEFALLLFESVFVLAGLSGGALVAITRAGQACLERRKKHQSEVRLKVAADKAMQLEHPL